MGLLIGSYFFPYSSTKNDTKSSYKKSQTKDPTLSNYIELHDLGKLTPKERVVVEFRRFNTGSQMLSYKFDPAFSHKDFEVEMEAVLAMTHANIQVSIGSILGHQLDEICNNYLLRETKKQQSQFIIPTLVDPMDIHLSKIKNANSEDIMKATGIQITSGVSITLLLGNGAPFLFSGDPMFGIPFYLTFFGGQEKMLANFKELNKRLDNTIKLK
ncbi:hypothetical protein ACTFIT_006446 [Dictyostelium discoideum]